MCKLFVWPAVMALLLLVNVAHADQLMRAEFYSTTGDDGKARNTAVFVTVLPAHGKVHLADIREAATSDTPDTEYAPGSAHTLSLIVKNRGATEADCAHFRFNVRIRAHGRNLWSVQKGTVVLYFDNGHTLTQEAGEFTLDSRNSRLVGSDWFGGK